MAQSGRRLPQSGLEKFLLASEVVADDPCGEAGLFSDRSQGGAVEADPCGWQGSTVRAILDNPPRYTGYAVFGRWTRHEVLADPDDIAAGHVTRFRRANAESVVRSRVPAHPAIVSVETFTRCQLLRRSRAAGGLEGRRKLEHGLHPAKHAYALRGLVRCGYCSRRMEGTPKHGREYYRCISRTLAPGSPALESHPRTVHLAERTVLPALNAWIGEVFDRDNIDRTVRELLASQEGRAGGATATDRDAAKRRLADAEKRLSRLRAAIEAGAEPAALVESLNAAQEQRVAAQGELAVARPDPWELSKADVYAMVDSLGDVGASLTRANPEQMRKIYKGLRLEMIYVHDDQALDVLIKALGGFVSVSDLDDAAASRPPARQDPYRREPVEGGRSCGVDGDGERQGLVGRECSGAE